MVPFSLSIWYHFPQQYGILFFFYMEIYVGALYPVKSIYIFILAYPVVLRYDFKKILWILINFSDNVHSTKLILIATPTDPIPPNFGKATHIIKQYTYTNF